MKTKKKKYQEKTDAHNNTQSDQRHDNDENTNSVNANKIPEETNGTQQQGDECDFIVMEEYSYNQELEEKVIKDEDDPQNLWNGFDLLWEFMEDQKRRMESIESTVKSLQRTTSSISSESVILSIPGYRSEKKSFDFPTKTESIKDRQLTDENNALSRTNRDLEDQLIKITEANKKLIDDNQRIQDEITSTESERNFLSDRIAVLENALSAFTKENNRLKKIIGNKSPIQDKEKEILQQTIKRIQLKGRQTTEDEEEELTEGRLNDFFTSQRSTCRNSDRRQPQRRASKFKSKRKTVIIGDSQLKYIRGENLSTRDTYMEVNSVSGAKVQQVPDLSSQELEDPIVSQIIVHIGTNSVGETSTEHLNEDFENLALWLKKKCNRVVFSSIIERYDKPDLNPKINSINQSLHELCCRLELGFIDNSNINSSNLVRDGLHINRSGQSKLLQTCQIFYPSQPQNVAHNLTFGLLEMTKILKF